MSSNSPQHFDAIIIGGSYAGMSAALQLVRARRKVLVIDSGQPRNRNSLAAHGFIAREGLPPAEIAAKARAELLAYPTLTWHEGRATRAKVLEEGVSFEVGCDDGSIFIGDRLVLAHGVTDTLPDIDGLAERWGRSVFHCPYCHGYEIYEGNIGIIGCSEDGGVGQALLLCDWGTITLFCCNPDGIDPEKRERLDECGATIESTTIQHVADEATVVLSDGRKVVLDALFLLPQSRLSCDLAEQLGCELLDAGCIVADSAKQTTVPGVFTCGDAGRMAGSIALAVGEGALVGVAVHRSLLGLLD
ncbi:NAD(P)/FAD-dependent oxidoreductase [uncultured Stenotrophomonas sp.]|uniref:NAD(P)/FAD-dependent oxidoreductase n=1 Tax=uncultured Stenotrophomonas sp. TaxID=165438 RepID=UPI0028EF7E02|nr:NAD(P)/FAD-dependent oxidoreductase [uncultured Stenotrophomonas sp.]